MLVNKAGGNGNAIDEGSDQTMKHTSSLDLPNVMLELNLCLVDSAMLVP